MKIIILWDTQVYTTDKKIFGVMMGVSHTHAQGLLPSLCLGGGDHSVDHEEPWVTLGLATGKANALIPESLSSSSIKICLTHLPCQREIKDSQTLGGTHSLLPCLPLLAGV